MAKQTPLYEQHLAAGGKMVDFAGWQMPLHYGSQIEEHHSVRRDAGMFDVSHMTVVDLHGARTKDFLRHLLANDVARLKVAGKALYSCMLGEDGGVIDDLIVYFLSDEFFRLVVNAATRDKDLAWIRQQAEAFGVEVSERADLAMIAVQGPHARAKVDALLNAEQRQAVAGLKVFSAVERGGWFIARTGYTGEDGYEIMVAAEQAASLWQALLEQGVAPIGLGARDSLRLEAGMNLYGSDMDETTTPLVSGLGWTVAFEPADRDFIGRAALEAQHGRDDLRKLVGLMLEGRGVLRAHQKVVVDGEVVGETTSGGFSPTLNRSIALARVDGAVAGHCQVEVRGRALDCRIVKPPFVRHGQACVEL